MTDIAEREAELEALIEAARKLDHEVDEGHVFYSMVDSPRTRGCEGCVAQSTLENLPPAYAVALALARALRGQWELAGSDKNRKARRKALADWDKLLAEIASERND